MSFLIFCFLVLTTPLSALLLKDQFSHATVGDFIVIEQERQVTLMHIFDKHENTLLLEEITLPEACMPRFSWEEWMKRGAPRNTSWILYEIALNSGKITKEYSFSRRCWLDPNQAANFLPTLLNLPFSKTSDQDRRRIGSAPEQGERDRRPLWHPKLIYKGKIVPGALFDSWSATWPRDGSQLSCAVIEIYLPSNSKMAPSYFPYWLQVSDNLAAAKIRIIDSGSGMVSAAKGFP